MLHNDYFPRMHVLGIKLHVPKLQQKCFLIFRVALKYIYQTLRDFWCSQFLHKLSQFRIFFGRNPIFWLCLRHHVSRSGWWCLVLLFPSVQLASVYLITNLFICYSLQFQFLIYIYIIPAK